MADPQKIRCGVIGAGSWASTAHLPALAEHPQAEITAVQKRDEAGRAKLVETFAPGHAVATTSELLAIDELDAVIVSSTPNRHYEQTRAALERGLHVLVEKPMTFTAAEARELVELARARGVELLVSCPWHYTAHGLAARSLISSGKLGKVRLISVLMTNPVDRLIKGLDTKPTHDAEFLLDPQAGSYSDPAIAGGGQVYTQVSHAAAYLSFLTGTEPAEVYARFDNAGSHNDIYDSLIVQMDDGPQVTLASTGATPLQLRNYEVRIFGEQGVLLLELWRGTFEAQFFDGTSRQEPPVPQEAIYPLKAPATNLIDVALGKAPNQSPGTLGLSSMEIIEGACRSAESGRPVRVREELYPAS